MDEVLGHTQGVGGNILEETKRTENRRDMLLKVAFVLFSVVVVALVVLPQNFVSAEAVAPEDTSQFGKHLDIWFMTFLIAILMMFIKKFEWGVAVAVLLSAAATYIVYFGIISIVEADAIAEAGTMWTQANLIRGSVASITVVVTIGCFIGTIKSWQYIIVGALFAPVFYLVEYLCIYFGDILMTNTGVAMDPGGAILVHMCAAYFGIGVISAIRDKRAFDEPMFSTTHSYTFAWLASMLLFMLWPSFVTAVLDPADVSRATAVCYMAGMGSIISAYLTCKIVQKKINPGIYAFTLLAGPVCMSPIMLLIDPFFAVFWGMLGGILSTLCFIYLQPWFCKKLGVLDVMGVHNLHGMAGWLGVIALFVMTKDLSVMMYALSMVAVTVVCGLLVGLVLRYTRGDMKLLLDDRSEFIFNEDPEHPEHDLSNID